jgi:hypothetical protein
MPLLVSKGPIPKKLDARYVDPQKRWQDLQKLRDYVASHAYGGWDFVAALSSVLNKSERDHFNNHWFGATTAFWNPIGSVTSDDLDEARRVITAGLVTALEASLGLCAGESPPLRPGSEVLIVADLARDAAINTYWVCGKAHGFECEVSWSSDSDWRLGITGGDSRARRGTVDFFVLTPPIREPVTCLVFPISETVLCDGLKNVVASRDHEGIVRVHGSGTSPTWAPVVELIAVAEGGLSQTPDPNPCQYDPPVMPTFGEPADPDTAFIWKQLVTTEAAEVLPGLENYEVDISPDDWLMSRRTLFIKWRVVAQHGRLDMHPTPGTPHSGPTFLGWLPTGQVVDVTIMSVAILAGPLGAAPLSFKSHIYDRMKALEDIGVQATGRPVIRNRTAFVV